MRGDWQLALTCNSSHTSGCYYEFIECLFSGVARLEARVGEITIVHELLAFWVDDYVDTHVCIASLLMAHLYNRLSLFILDVSGT